MDIFVKSETQSPPATLNTIDTVFDQNVQLIYRYVYRRVGNREDAEDLTSEIFLKASRDLDIHRSEASIVSWLFTVARTVLADHWRRYYRHGSVLRFEDLQAYNIHEHVDAGSTVNEADGQLEQILAALPERHRRVLELRFLRGLTIKETAQEMGVTPENVKIMQHRGLARAAIQRDTVLPQDGAPASSNEIPRTSPSLKASS